MCYNGYYNALLVLIRHINSQKITSVRIEICKWFREVGFGSNLEVVRRGEYSNSIRTYCPSPRGILPLPKVVFTHS